MKKTTTRLATTAAVLIMSAFAIVLAHHDARKRDSTDQPAPLISSSEQGTTPLEMSEGWTAHSMVVRGNNNGNLTAFNSDGLENNPLREVPTQLPGDPLAEYEKSYDHQVDSNVGPSDQDDSWNADVVPVAGEQNTATGQPVAKLSSPLPSTSTDNSSLLPLPKFPEGLPSSSSPGTANSMPALPGSQPLANAGDASPPAASSASQNPVAHTSVPVSPPPVSQPPSNPAASAMPGGQVSDWPATRQPAASGRSGSLPATDLTSSGSRPAWMSNHPSQTVAGSPQSSGIVGQPPSMPSSNVLPQPSAATSVATPSAQVAPGSIDGRPISASTSLDGGVTSLPSMARTALVSNQPGSRFLDGSQNPVVQIHKRAPEEIQVGKRATFVITVRNAGNAIAHEVTVVDRVPRGAKFAESSPSANPTSDGTLTWNLGELAAGDERTISLQIVPEVEGEVGSVASVHFAAQASVRTVATSPRVELQVDLVGPVTIGQSQAMAVSIKNAGSGVSKGIRLEADIPAQLRHESGESQLEAYIGDLRPNESRRLTLNLAAVQPGQAHSLLRAVNDDGIQAEQNVPIDVRAPQLAATIAGPALRYLERQATYQVKVTNSGTAMARNLDFVVHLPVGLKYVGTDIQQATYDPQTHCVTLGLAELDSGQSAPFSVSVLPVQLGPQVIRVNASGDLNLAAEAKAQVSVAGLAELAFTIGQDNGTVEVGASTTYSVQVTNIGNQPDKNVQLQVQLPEGANLLQVDAPVDYRVEAESGRIIFAPVAEMHNRDVKTYRFQIQHQRAGNQVIRSQLTSENWPVAVVKEEGTLVYNDQN